jgi:hypothetical protein
MSIFNLPQAPTPISDTGVVGYRQIDLSTALNPANFIQNTHTFRFSVDGQTYWLPQRSYIRVRAKITRDGVNALSRGDAVAPAYGFCSTLFQSLQHDMSGSTVSQLSSYVAQIDAMRYRTSKSEAWRETLGPLTNAYGDFVTRQNLILRSPLNEEETKFVHCTKASLIANAPAANAIGVATTFTVTAISADSFTAGEVYSVGVAGTLAEGTATSHIALGGGALWTAYTDRVQIGDFIVCNYPADPVPHRTKIVNISGATLAVFPAIPALGAAAGFNFEIQHSVGKQTSVPAGEIEFLWSPPLSIWQDVSHGIPASIHELRLTPNQNFAKDCLESLNPRQNPTVQITDMRLFISVVDGPLAGSSDGKGQYILNVSDWVCNANQVPINVTNLRLATFDVHPSTTQLAFAFQNSTTTGINNPTSLYTSLRSEERKLGRFFIQYAGQQRPTPDSDSSLTDSKLDAMGKNFFTQRWYESLINTNALFSPGGVESMATWLQNGPFYYFNWPKAPTDISTRVSIQFIMENTVDNLNMLMFSRSNTAHLISLSNGRVVGVETQNIFGQIAPTMTAPMGPQTSGGPMTGMGGGRMSYRY